MPTNKTNTITMSIPNIQLLVLKYHFLLKERRVSERNGYYSCGEGNVQDEHGTSCYNSEEASQDYWGIELPYGLAMLFLQPRESKTIRPPENLHIKVHRSKIIARMCKSLKCLSTDEWIYKMWYNGSLQEK